ncbi:MAG TPA: hypothetical protein VNY07_05980 [Chthoniobacterales bacterium]|jgi:hypothetical protein|nr:hypothetical protein [Chthoniobacterales bacterium]
MSRTDSAWGRVALRVCLAATCCAAGVAQAELPRIGSQTSDGFTVTARWHFQYRSKRISDDRYWIDKPVKSEGNARGEAHVTEEVNKSTGKSRAVIQDGSWSVKISGLHYTDAYGNKPACGPDQSAQGPFRHTHVSHGVDAETKKPVVSFDIDADEPGGISPKMEIAYHDLVHKNPLELVVSDKWRTQTISAGVSGGCRVPYKTGFLSYRKRTPENGSPDHFEEIVITRTDQEFEAEIKPAEGFNFKDWVPTMTGAIAFEVRLVSPPDLPVQWKIWLYKTSSLPGVCCNAEMPPKIQAQWENKIKRDEYDLIFDFRKYGKTDPSFKPVDKHWQVLETSKPVTGTGFIVNCLDYGASGRVAAMAFVEGQAVGATYKETGETFVRIPYAKNKNDQHRIADAATPTGLSTRYPAGSPDADDDNDPPNEKKFQGDGLSVFEEYRGFVCKAGFAPGAGGFEHFRLDPQKKDLFVFTDGWSEELAAYLLAFANASHLNVHWLGDDDDGFVRASDRVVNFNSDQPPKKLQHALNLLEDTLPKGTLGQTRGYGPPKYVSTVTIDVDQCRDMAGRFPLLADQLKHTTIHELGHGVGIDHHGDTNIDQNFIALEGGQNSGDVTCAMKYVHWRFYQHKPRNSTTPQPYDPTGLEKPGLTFCTSPIGNAYNQVGTHGWQCGNADRGNCLAQIRVNDKAPTPKAVRGQDVSAPTDTPAAPPDDEVEKAARESQKRAGVALGLRLAREQGQIIPGEAITFELSLRGMASKASSGTWDAPVPSGKAQADFGATNCPWTNQIHFLILDEKGKLVPLPAKSYAVGTVQRVDSSGGHEFQDPKIELKPDAIYVATFAVDGAQTAKWAPGTSRIFAAIPSGESGAGDILSRSIMLPVVAVDALPPDEQKSAPARRELSQGYIEFAAKHWAEAEQRARGAISGMPNSTEPYLLLAKSLEAQDKPKEAYVAYNEALTRYRPAPGTVAEPPDVILVALKALEEKLGIQPEPPPPVAIGPLAAHSLFAQSAGNKLNPPFPAHPDQLIFEWQLTAVSNDPLGVRWIAEEVAGVEKNHVIATAKSDPNKQSSQFSLTKPSAGFPPGQYRVEIWQRGKMIYSEKFEIKSE